MNSQSKVYVCSDKETIPDLVLLGSDYEKGKFNDPLYHEIVALSMSTLVPKKVGRETVYITRTLGTARGTERENIQTYADYLERIDFCLVGFNNHSFDEQVLISRALKHGVSLPAMFLRGNKYDAPTKRYGGTYKIDLCDALSNFGASKKVSLDKYAKAVGLPGKMGIAGDQVEAMYAEGRLEEIRNYCETDVLTTSGLFLRYQRLRGILSGKGFRLSAESFLNFIEEKAVEKPHLREFLDNVDLDRFLNAGPSPSEEAEAARVAREQASKTQSDPKVKLKLVEDF